jgi:anti-sigma regulatory factor (Ser/Thr protein kinase)
MNPKSLGSGAVKRVSHAVLSATQYNIATNTTTLEEHLALAGDEVAPAVARRFVRETLASQRLSANMRDDVELLVSELVTNVVRHAHTNLDLRIRLRRDSVCLIVQDYSQTQPHVRNDAGQGGWGLRLVEELAAEWGVQQQPTGKAVWVVLPRSTGPLSA